MPPITPMPPEFVTVAANLGPAATFMPASMMGWFILNNLVKGVENTGSEEGILGVNVRGVPM